jgi:hypothetical protein
LWALAQAAAAPGDVEKPPPTVKMRIAADAAGKGRKVTVRLDTAGRDPVTLLDRGRSVSFGIRARWRPWSIATADLIGDGRREIVVALYKSTRYLPEKHNCLFVYRYNGQDIYPLWLGSTLGRPFTAFAFDSAATGRGARLVTLDLWLDGRRGITIHRWTGFGFHKEASWGSWRSARLLSVREGRVEVIADGERLNRSLEGK